jgi:two-component system, NtrC family, sensor histidine kinase AtoS
MSSPDERNILLECQNIAVERSGKTGIKNISFQVEKGEIHAIVGNHGCGKSTLIDVIAGVTPKTAGSLYFDGKLIDRFSSSNALKLGIQTLPQTMCMVEHMNSFENIFLNRELKKFLFFNDAKKMREKTLETFRIIDLEADPDIPIRYHNSVTQQQIETAKVLCFPSKLLLVDQVSDRLPPEYLEKLQYILSRLVQQGTTIIYTTDNIDEIVKFASKVTILKDGEIIDTVELSDINPDKLVNLTFASIFSRSSLEKSNLELFYLNNLIRNVIDNLPIAILVINSKQEIILLNKAMESRYSIHLKDLYEKSIKEVDLFAVEDFETIREKLESNQVIIKENCRINEAGRSLVVSLSAFPFFDEDQSPLGTIFLFIQKEDPIFGEEVENFASALKKQNELIGIAHEINNPLGIILNYIQLIKNSSGMDDQMKGSVDTIDKEIKRIKRILRRLTQSDNTFEEQVSSVSVYKITGEVLSLLEPQLKKKGIDTSVEIDEAFYLRIDLDMFKQVLLNITINSLEAMDGRGEITIRQIEMLKENKKYVGIEIMDTGKGITRSNIDRIFDPFFTTKTDSDSRGIGLSLCKDIMEKVNGFIEVESEEGKGASFRILLQGR